MAMHEAGIDRHTMANLGHGEQIQVGRGLAPDAVGCGGDGRKVLPEPGAVEHLLDLRFEGPGGHGERNVLGEHLHAVGRTREQNRRARQHLVDDMRLRLHPTIDGLGCQREALILRQRLKQPDIVITEISGVVVVFPQIDAVGGQDRLVRAKMQRLAVGDDAVEVEEHGLKPLEAQGRRSPARIGRDSTLSRGGYGQSYDAL